MLEPTIDKSSNSSRSLWISEIITYTANTINSYKVIGFPIKVCAVEDSLAVLAGA